MVIVTPASLEGDGINASFFHLLWNKDNAPTSSSSMSTNTTTNTTAPPPPLRIPDTVVFQYGQPLHWYFTSKRGGKDGKTVTILRKRKQNVTIEKIEELFLKKASTRGVLGDHDVVAYFIASADCTSRFRRRQSDGGSCNDGDDGLKDDSAVGNACNVGSYTNADSTTTCDIEYFDQEGLKEFLAHGRKNQTGILQRFMQPTGGGTHNSLIQAIWTPNLCLMERRRTKQSLLDARFGLYERTVTFEGPDVHSMSKPIRGTVLGNKIKHLCNEMVRHVSEVTGTDNRKRSRGGSRSRNTAATRALAAPMADRLSRMVVYFKVDINDNIWVLFTSSLRLDGTTDSNTCSQNALELLPTPTTGTLLQPLNNNANNCIGSSPSMPLNINSIVKLGPNIKLNPKANHDPNKILDNEVTLSYCPSCGLDVPDERFCPVPYKTIISHFEHAIDMMKDELGLDRLIEWPPDTKLIEAAGGVGFGSYMRNKARGSRARNAKAVSELPEEDTLIPPVVRQIHGRLKAQGYRRYRNDPLFLHRNSNVCEHCFLSYAQLASTSFQMINPIRIDDEERRERLTKGRRGRSHGVEEEISDRDWSEDEDNDEEEDDQSEEDFLSGHFGSARIHGEATRSIGMLLSNAPQLPPVILEPPTDDYGEGSVERDIGATRINASSLPMHASLHPPATLDPINMDVFLAKHMAPSIPPRHPYNPSSNNVRHPLQHLISSYQKIERVQQPTQPVLGTGTGSSRRKQQHNPYQVSQRIVDPRGQRTSSICKPTKSQRRKNKATDNNGCDEQNRVKEEGEDEGHTGSALANKSTARGLTRDETSTSSDISRLQTQSSAAKLSVEDKQLLTSALSEIYEKQREMTLSQSQLLIPESLY